MLVLSRKPGESIVICGQVHVHVIETRSGRVRLGITAPPSMPVDRAEIHEQRTAQAERESVQLGVLPDDPAGACHKSGCRCPIPPTTSADCTATQRRRRIWIDFTPISARLARDVAGPAQSGCRTARFRD